jgi:hypothetical protein
MIGAAMLANGKEQRRTETPKEPMTRKRKTVQEEAAVAAE